MRTIAHISDLHFGTERPELVEALRQELHAAPPSLVVISGDFTQRARRRQFVSARDYLRTLPGPQLVVPGNHDIPLFDVARRFLAPLTRYRRHISAELDPVFDDGELFVAGLNSARSLTWKSGRISHEQIAALRRKLQGTRARYRVVVTHHPFIPPPVSGAETAKIDLLGRAARAMVVLDSGQVDLLLAGHLHHAYAGDTRTQYPAARRAIVSAQAQTATSHRIRGDHPNGYNRVSFDGETLAIEIRAWQDAAFRPVARSVFRRDASGWHPVAPSS